MNNFVQFVGKPLKRSVIACKQCGDNDCGVD